MATVRDFCRRRFGRKAMITRDTGNLADVALGDTLDPALVHAILERTGFRDPGRAHYNIRTLGGTTSAEREAFCQLIVMAEPVLRANADCDMALNNWERFAESTFSRTALHESLLREPRHLEVFLEILGASQFLADVLVRNPEFLAWVLQPEQLLHVKAEDDLERDVRAEIAARDRPDHRMAALARIRRREILRIGVRDLCLGLPLAATVADLSALARVLVRATIQIHADADPEVRELLDQGAFHLLAVGKLGASELNYSSDIDLLACLDDRAPLPSHARDAATRLVQTVTTGLAAVADHGQPIYRTDMRLRPYGRAGPLVPTLSALQRYFDTHARPWEVQAVLKAGPVWGTPDFCRDLARDLLARGLARHPYPAFLHDARRSRRPRPRPADGDRVDIKNGTGGIRDLEFTVQLLQVRHVGRCPLLARAATLDAIDGLVDHDLVSPGDADAMRLRYDLLRRLEHLLQIMYDTQSHDLPTAPDRLLPFARRLRHPGGNDAGVRLRDAVNATLAANRTALDALLATA
jgi:glutamate-ammonia-ligase adenylyltransferase